MCQPVPKMKKPSDIEVLESVNIYYSSGNISPFIEKGGIWIMENVKKYCMANDDEVSDLFLLFHSKAKTCLDVYKNKYYTNFFGFLFVYAKNLLRNLRRKEQIYKSKHVDVMLDSLNIPSYKFKPSISAKTLHSAMDTDLLFKERLIICLKYHIKLSNSDESDLFFYLKTKGISSLEFWTSYRKMKQKKDLKQAFLLKRVNKFNEALKIAEPEKMEELKQNKEKYYNKLFQRSLKLSFKEIGNLLNISMSQCRNLHRSGLAKLRIFYIKLYGLEGKEIDLKYHI